jgi:hypothetical protein
MSLGAWGVSLVMPGFSARLQGSKTESGRPHEEATDRGLREAGA